MFKSLGAEDVTEIRALCVGFAFHQFFEGIGLGAASIESKMSLLPTFISSLLFCLTVPIGIVIGMFSKETELGVLVQGVADAIASGMLIYTSLVCMISEDFQTISIKERPYAALSMYFSLMVGTLSMAVVAIWA
jgi:zinc transporter 1/2/3